MLKLKQHVQPVVEYEIFCGSTSVHITSTCIQSLQYLSVLLHSLIQKLSSMYQSNPPYLSRNQLIKDKLSYHLLSISQNHIVYVWNSIKINNSEYIHNSNLQAILSIASTVIWEYFVL